MGNEKKETNHAGKSKKDKKAHETSIGILLQIY